MTTIRNGRGSIRARLSMVTVTAVLLLAPCFPLRAQLTRGSLSGSVQDGSGALIGGVVVTATEVSTNFVRKVETSEEGIYRFAALEPGVYSLEYRKVGFQTLDVVKVELTATQDRVLNESLQLAQAITAVEVASTPASVELSKASAAIERSLGAQMLENLPATGLKDVNDLMVLTPTVVRVRNATQPTSTGGQRSGAENFLIDGVDNRESWFSGRMFSVLPEGAAELRVQTNAFSAEFGRGMGSQVLVTTKSGTNGFRGQLWDYYTADWLSALTLANKAGSSAVPRPRSQLNTPGISFGGPLRRDRTFFFILFSKSLQREGANSNGISPITIPTAQGWSDLARAPLGAGQSEDNRRAVLDSISFLPQVHRMIRSYDSVSTALVNGVPIQMGTTRIPVAKPFDGEVGQARVDHHLSNRDTLTYSYQRSRYDAPVASTLSNNRFGSLFAAAERHKEDGHRLSYMRLLTTTAVNEFRISRTKVSDEWTPEGPLTTQVSIAGGSFLFGTQMIDPYIRRGGNWEWQDSLTWMRGRHSIKLGAGISRLPLLQERHNERGQWAFDSLENFLNNRALSLTQPLKASVLQTSTVQQGYFLQDDIRLRPNLILNAGLRYQTANVPNGGFGTTDPALVAIGVLAPAQPDRNDFAPRIGIAWSPGQRTVLRGGFGISYSQNLNVNQNASNNYPNNIVLARSGRELVNLFPALPEAVASIVNPSATFTNVPPHDQNPTTHFYSASVQRQFGPSYFLEVGYSGNRAYHLSRSVERNPAILTPSQAAQVIASQNANSIPTVLQRRLNPAWGSRILTEGGAGSRYNAGYVRFDRRLAHGLMVGANYTFSATLDNGSSSQNAMDFRPEYGRASVDRPHRAVVFYSWQAPSPRIPVLRQLMGGWQLSGFSEWQSGEPFSITTGVDTNGDGNPNTDRPDYNSAGILSLDLVTHDWRSFNVPLRGNGVFVTALQANGAPLSYSRPDGGALGRNTFRGPSFSNWNLSVVKIISTGERVRTELRADATDAFNHRNFGPPNSVMSSPSFGKNESEPGSRVVMLGIKVRF